MFDRHVATAFVALVAQNASINVLAKVTRTGNKENLYAPGTLVILCETFKILLSLIFAANERKNQASASSSSAKGKRDHVGLLQSAREVVRDVLVVRRSELAGAALPSLLYAASNNLSYIGVTYLETIVYVITLQLKLFASAICNALIYRRNVSLWRWLSLALLASGVICAQIPPGASIESAFELHGDKAKGLAALITACLCSGLAGAVIENSLKGSGGQSLWVRNLQICIPAFGFSCMALYLNKRDWAIVTQQGFFHGYTMSSWLLCANACVGGLLVSYLVRYSGSLTKGFATSLAIVLSAILSQYFVPGESESDQTNVMLGSGQVVAASLLYAAC